MHAKTKCTELYLISSLMYVEKFTSFCQEKCPQKKIGSFFLPHSAVIRFTNK